MANHAELIGREREQEQTLAGVLSGRGTAILGPQGVGKTTLAAAVAARLPVSRFTVIRAVATEASRTVPFGAFDWLLPAEEGHRETPTRDRLVRWFADAVGTRTPVILIDDAHYLDGRSAALMLGLVGDNGGRLLVTARPEASMPDAVVALWKDGYLRRLDLAPFDHAGTTRLVEALVGGEVAASLHGWTGGNPRYLSEVIRHGRATGRIVSAGGLWWWRGPLTVPRRLAELFEHRLRGLDVAVQDVLAAVALGEPASLAVLETLAPGVAEGLERDGLLRCSEHGGRLLVRLREPMLAEALRHRLTVLHRRRLTTALLEASRRLPAEAPDPVVRARWQLDAGGPVDTRLLTRAADATYQHEPRLACRFARRVLERSAAGAVPLARALTELGDTGQARQILERAAAAGTGGQRLAAGIALAAHRCWAERDPASAHEDLLVLRDSTVSRAARAAVDGVTALVLLFAGHADESVRVARRVVAEPDQPRPAGGAGEVAARVALAVGLALTGRTTAAVAAATALAMAPPPGQSYAAGAGAAALAFAQLWRSADVTLPAGELTYGRWPREAGDGGQQNSEWSVLAGHARRLSGDLDGAIARLREAVVHQDSGLRLFRSEAAGWLAECLAGGGRPDDAQAVLATYPPDGVGVLPGQATRAAAAVAAARGDLPAGRAAIAAAIAAARSGACWSVEVDYLTEAAWLAPRGGSTGLRDRLTTALRHVDAPRLIAQAEGVLAWHRDDGTGMLDCAARLHDLAMPVPAWRLADGAAAALHRRGGVRHGEAVALAGRLRLGLRSPTPAQAPASLTGREVEIAALAAGGLSDREISRRLAVSVRTVQSHLGRVYGKLGVHSRRDLPTGLGKR